jgi:hypothetical protein
MRLYYEEELLAPRSNPQAEKITPCRLSATAYSIHLKQSSKSRGPTHLQPEYMPRHSNNEPS